MKKISHKISLVVVLVTLVASGLALGSAIFHQIAIISQNLNNSCLSLAKVTAEVVYRGYLTRTWPLKTLSEIVRQEDNIFCWIVDSKGEIVMAGRTEYFGKKIPAGYLLKTQVPVIFRTIYQGKPINLTIYPVRPDESPDWSVYLGTSIKSLILARNRAIYNNLIIFLGAIIISILLSLFLTRPIVLPIVKLTKAISKVGEGKYPKQLKIETKDEIGQLTSAFNLMCRNLEKSELALKQKAKQLENMLKMKTEFLHVINHQLRTPISILRGYVNLLASKHYQKFPPEKQQEIKNKLVIATEKLARLTNTMVDAVELEGGYWKPKISSINLVKLVNSAYSSLAEKYHQKNLYFKLNVPADIPEIKSDSKYLELVIYNLLSNACEFTEKGGVTVSLEKQDDFVIIKVKDTGIGLSEVDKQRLFKKFTRGEIASSISPSGSGLGLYIVSQILTVLKGEIKAESKGRNKGTTFILKLPINYYG